MKLSKDFIKGLSVGLALSLMACSTTVYAASKFYIFKNGASYEMVNLAVGSKVIPPEKMPNQLPAITIDTRTYVPLRAAVDAVGGDVTWDNKTKTASVIVASNIIALRNGEMIDFLGKDNQSQKFIASIPIEMFDAYNDYELMWIIEYENGQTYGGESIRKVSVTNRGISDTYTSTYSFYNKGLHTIKLKMKKVGTENWITAARRVYNVE